MRILSNSWGAIDYRKKNRGNWVRSLLLTIETYRIGPGKFRNPQSPIPPQPRPQVDGCDAISKRKR